MIYLDLEWLETCFWLKVCCGWTHEIPIRRTAAYTAVRRIGMTLDLAGPTLRVEPRDDSLCGIAVNADGSR